MLWDNLSHEKHAYCIIIDIFVLHENEFFCKVDFDLIGNIFRPITLHYAEEFDECLFNLPVSSITNA